MIFRDIKILIEMRDFIFNTDLYVIRFLLDYYLAYDCMYNDADYLQKKLLMLYGDKQEDEIIEMLTLKRNFNPLYDLVEYSKAPEGFHVSLLDDLYNNILYGIDYMASKNLKFTLFSDTIKPLIKMDQCKEITLYTEYDIPEYIEALIINKFNSNKITLITGDINYILSTEVYDSYFIRNVNHIENLCKPYHERRDVVIPLFRSNITFNGEKEIIDTPVLMEDITHKYNIELRGAQLPL